MNKQTLYLTRPYTQQPCGKNRPLSTQMLVQFSVNAMQSVARGSSNHSFLWLTPQASLRRTLSPSFVVSFTPKLCQCFETLCQTDDLVFLFGNQRRRSMGCFWFLPVHMPTVRIQKCPTAVQFVVVIYALSRASQKMFAPGRDLADQTLRATLKSSATFTIILINLSRTT